MFRSKIFPGNRIAPIALFGVLTLFAMLTNAAYSQSKYNDSTESKSKKTQNRGESRDTDEEKAEKKGSDTDTSGKSKAGSKSSRDNESDSEEGNEKSDRTGTTNYSAAAVNAPINPAAFNDQMLSQLIFDLTNQERRRAGLKPFDSNRYLAYSAAAHSRDMASRGYFNHKSKGFFNRTDPHERIASAGYGASRMTAENIAMIPTFNSQRIQSYPGYGRQVIDTDYNSYSRMAHYAVQQWMESPGHRQNILNTRLTELGVGVAIGIRENVPYVYLTQNFGG